MKKKIFAVLALAVIAWLAVKLLLPAHVASEASLRHTDRGDLVGFDDLADTHAWLGVPFAEAPIGSLRWRAPRPVGAWQGTREALEHGPMCPQLLPFDLFGRRITLGSEDCLYLDIQAPRLTPAQVSGARLPVMVWIHGGANTMGTSSAISPYQLAGDEGVIVVSLQYRLGVLGWLSHPALRHTASGADATSNFATLDMIAALQWVQRNIAAFGGDPGNVTIFGQSAGGFQVYALVASPLATGLFQRAIVESGNIQTLPQSLAENYRDDPEPGLPFSAREFVNTLLVNDGRALDRQQAKVRQNAMADSELADYLRAKPVDELLAAVTRRPTLGYFVAANIRDGYALPRASLLDVFADPRAYNRVPMMIGSNRDEYKLWLWSNDSLVERQFGLLPHIRDVDAYQRINRYFSDQWQAIAVTEPGAVLAASQPGQVFGYRFDWDYQKTLAGVDMAELFGAAHGIEVTFLYGPEAVKTLPWFAMAEDPDARAGLARAMRGYWAAFARNGDPGNGGDATLPVWEPWQPGAPQLMLLDSRRGGGIRMAPEAVSVREIKQRLRDDPHLATQRARCRRYAELFWYALTLDFWRDDEWRKMGCERFSRDDFSAVF